MQSTIVPQPTLTMHNGVTIPQIGYGVYQIAKEETARCVREAIEVGYRHIDTAQAYFNEAEVGIGVRDSGVARGDLFITTKVWISNYGYERTLASVEDSLSRMGTDYLDLVLLHQPFGDCYGAWRALERLHAIGTVRAIGVSNFAPDRLVDLGAFNEMAPMVNQIETNPLNQQRRAHDVMTERGVVHEAWAPFGEGRAGLFDHPVLSAIGERYGKSTAQVMLRWLIQRGIVVLPKTTHRDRMEQNLDIVDFALDETDMAAIAALDTATSLFFDHSDPQTVDRMAGFIKERAGRV